MKISIIENDNSILNVSNTSINDIIFDITFKSAIFINKIL